MYYADRVVVVYLVVGIAFDCFFAHLCHSFVAYLYATDLHAVGFCFAGYLHLCPVHRQCNHQHSRAQQSHQEFWLICVLQTIYI